MTDGPAWVAAAAVAFAATAGSAPLLLDLLARRGICRPAYDGLVLPTAGGLSLLLGLAAGLSFVGRPPAASLLAVVCGAGAWGLLDDWAGDDRRGWAAHLDGLLRRTWSSGSAKIVGIGLTGLAATGSPLGAVAVALTANLLNLLDRRPARAVKGGCALALLWAGLAPRPDAAAPLLPLLAGALAWLPFDAGRRGMLGDAGANALGAALGWAAFALLPGERLLPALAAIAGLQLLGDRASLSARIDRCAPLRWLDRLGVAAAQAARGGVQAARVAAAPARGPQTPPPAAGGTGGQAQDPAAGLPNTGQVRRRDLAADGVVSREQGIG